MTDIRALEPGLGREVSDGRQPSPREAAIHRLGRCWPILETAVVSGLRGELVHVEVDVAPGLPGCHIVGLPDAALSEARERVRSAIRHAGFTYPLSRITVNLAPADRRKHGAAYDVAIAIGILLASEQLRASGGSWALLGELSLDGSVTPVRGRPAHGRHARDAGHRRVCVPIGEPVEAQLVPGLEMVGAEGLDDVARLVAGPRGRTAARARRRPGHPCRRQDRVRGPPPAPSGAGDATWHGRSHRPGRRTRPGACPLGARGRPRRSPQPPARGLPWGRQDAPRPGRPQVCCHPSRRRRHARSPSSAASPATRPPAWAGRGAPSWHPITRPRMPRWWAVDRSFAPDW